MNPLNNKANVAAPAATVATNATQAVSFDTSGADFANIKVLAGTCATTSVAFSTLKFSESDTLTTPSSMTDIVALTGGTATSTSAGYVLPTSANSAGGGVVAEFQLDLRKRKKYVGIQATPGQSLVFGMVAELSKDESADTAADKALTNNSATSASGCVTVVAV